MLVALITVVSPESTLVLVFFVYLDTAVPNKVAEVSVTFTTEFTGTSTIVKVYLLLSALIQSFPIDVPTLAVVRSGILS